MSRSKHVSTHLWAFCRYWLSVTWAASVSAWTLPSWSGSGSGNGVSSQFCSGNVLSAKKCRSSFYIHTQRPFQAVRNLAYLT